MRTSKVASQQLSSRVLSLVLCLAVVGCDSKHLLLATAVDVRDIGQAVTSSFAVIAPDNARIIYVRDDGASDSMVTRDIVSRAERALFSVPAGAELWTTAIDSGTLLLTVGGQVVEYALDGSVRMSYSLASGTQDRFPSRSPDGRTLVFLRKTLTSGQEVLMFRDATTPDSPVQTLWSFLHGEDIKAVHWVDDNRVLVSCLTTQGTPGVPDNKVWDIPSRSGVAEAGLGASATPGSTGHYVVSFHPPDQLSDAYLSRIDGTGMTRLTNSAGSLGRFSWSRDGQIIVCQETRQTATHLQLVYLPPLR